MEFDILSNKVIGCALDVHRELGPGLKESAYKKCLAIELSEKKIDFLLEKSLPVLYKGMEINCEYRIDFIIEDKLILEIKSVEKIVSVYSAQIITYMKLSKITTGLLINFNSHLLRDGIKGFIL
jgi:GxxExxY protein